MVEVVWRQGDTTMKIDNVEQLFLHGLKYVYGAEQQLTEGLPKLAEASSSPELRQAFEQHFQETKEHVARAQQIFKQFGQVAHIIHLTGK